VVSYELPAPFPAPATPLPAAVTIAPVKFPTPEAAALVALDMPPVTPLMAFVMMLWFWGGVGAFFGAAGTGFF
jgi:hypothetical protein